MHLLLLFNATRHFSILIIGITLMMAALRFMDLIGLQEKLKMVDKGSIGWMGC